MIRPRSGSWLAALLILSLAALLAAEERARLYGPVGLAAAGIALARFPGFRLPERAWRLLSVAALAGFLAELFVFGGSSLFAAVHLLLYLLVNRAHHLERSRDAAQLLLVTFLILLAVSVLAVVALVLPLFVAYLVVALRGLEVLHLRFET